MKKYIIAIDEGTSSVRALLWNTEKAEVESIVSRPIKCFYPEPDWVEQDGAEIYATLLEVINEMLQSNNVRNSEVYSIGITNQREAVILWDKDSGRPVMPLISWQDRRTAAICAQLRNSNRVVRDKTGLNIDAYFSATKLKWAFDSIPGLRKRAENGEILWGTIDTYLVWRLTNGKKYVTDMSNASRTMLFNINTLEWDKELFEIFDVPFNVKPQIVNTVKYIGDAVLEGGNIPICAIIGDQQSALFGQACSGRGDAKVTYGTGAFLLLNIGDVPKISENSMLTSVAWSINGKVSYALEGSIYNAGSAVQWIRDNMGFIKSAKESEKAALSVKDNNGVYFVPAFSGLGAPYWDNDASGIICGLTRGTTKEHIVRATLEAMAYGVRDILESLSNDFEYPSKLRVDGGACENDFLMQFQADILKIDIVRPSNLETSAMGAVYAAGIGARVYKDIHDIELKTDRIFTPDMDENVRKRLYAGWKRAVGRSRYSRRGL